tara:strand:- start:23856 stop:24377 length:522 start_codon:yes stop_codon:yes gene_type:complete
MLSPDQLISMLEKYDNGLVVNKHEALFTVEDSKKLRGKIKGAHSKNLFLKNKKNNFFLISCEEFDKVDLKKISKGLGLGNISFAKEEYLKEHLGILPGSVSPFALLNDKNNVVNFYLEKKLYESTLINFHPLINTVTTTMKTQKFIEFMIEKNKKIHIFSSFNQKIIKSYEPN